MTIPSNKEVSFIFTKDAGFVQTLSPRTEAAGCVVVIEGTISASSFIGMSGGSGSVGPQGPSGSQGPQGVTGSTGPAGSAPNISYVTSFTTSDFFSAPANNLRGNAAGFTACVLVEPDNFATATESLFGNWSPYQASGGWFLGIDDSRFKFGVGQQSDGVVADNFGTGLQSTSNFQGRLIQRFYLLHLAYDGTTARLYVNGQVVQTLTPSSGYEIANASLAPYIGKTNNVGEPLPATSLGYVGSAYVESNMTATQVLNHYKQCLAADTLVDASFSNMWLVTSGSMVLEDQIGSVDFTVTGTPTQITVAARW